MLAERALDCSTGSTRDNGKGYYQHEGWFSQDMMTLSDELVLLMNSLGNTSLWCQSMNKHIRTGSWISKD